MRTETDSARLQVTDLDVAFTDPEGRVVSVIDGISFHAEPGQMLCLAGRSGSGKSSIIKQLVGITRSAPGSVIWNGDDISARSRDELARLRRTTFGYVDQASGLVEHLTALENVLLPLVPDGKRIARRSTDAARGFLTALGLEKRIAWTAARLSGGERQRVTIARAMLSGTPALVIDEPTASLDRSWADRVINQLRELTRAGRTVIVASHDPGFFAAADTVIRLEGEAGEGMPAEQPLTRRALRQAQ